MSLLLETKLPNFFHRGKVRDTYDLGDKLLIVATDRVSAFDVVLPTGIPDRGVVLTYLSAFWFRQTAELVPNHFIALAEDVDDETAPGMSWLAELPEEVVRRGMVVHNAQRIDVECVVRGYLAGSGWVEYQESGSVCGIKLPKGLRQCERLPRPIFTPTTKAETGHDEPITFEEMVKKVGKKVAEDIRHKSLALYSYGEAFARSLGIIIADTKMEFGLIGDRLCVIDELLTPDSSRFWDVESYEPGRDQPSFDKQIVRNWLTESGWNKQPPAPALPQDIVDRTADKYREIYRRLTGKDI